MQRKMHVIGNGMYVDEAIVPYQELADLVEECKILRETGLGKSDGDMPMLGKFHPWHVENYCNKWGITFQEFMQDQKTHARRLLAQDDMKPFRIAYKG